MSNSAQYALTLKLRPAKQDDFAATNKAGEKVYQWNRMYWVKTGPENFSFHLFVKGSLKEFGQWFTQGLVYVSDMPEWMVKAKELEKASK